MEGSEVGSVAWRVSCVVVWIPDPSGCSKNGQGIINLAWNCLARMLGVQRDQNLW